MVCCYRCKYRFSSIPPEFRDEKDYYCSASSTRNFITGENEYLPCHKKNYKGDCEEFEEKRSIIDCIKSILKKHKRSKV